MKNIKDNIIITFWAIIVITFYSFIFYSMYRIDHLKVIDTKRYKVEATIIDTWHRSAKTEYIYVKGIMIPKDISAMSVITLKINGKNKKQEISTYEYFKYQDRIGETINCELVERSYNYMNIKKQSVEFLE